MLLLDEMRSYKAQLAERATYPRQEGSQGTCGEDVFESFARSVGSAVDRVVGDSAGATSDRSSGGSGTDKKDGSASARSGIPALDPPPRTKRVFRDGKWVTL